VTTRRPPTPKRPPAASGARPARRLGICSALIVLAFGLLAARVGQLQIANGAKYKKLSVDLALHTIPLPAERGSIFDRDGRDLAMSITRTTVYADPTLVVDPTAEAARLAPVLHVPEPVLVAAMADKGSPDRPRRFAYLAHTVDDNVAALVQAMRLPGIGFVPESARTYPADPIAASVVGRVHSDGSGSDGVELEYNNLLQGKAGSLVVEQDPLGHDIPNTERTQVDARRGTDVVLTLDEDMQWQTEYSLLDQVKATNANGGMAVVLDVDTGDVLSMATVRGAKDGVAAHVASGGDANAPLTDLFEPGSTNKLITLSWALEHGHVTPNTMFSVPYLYSVNSHVKPYADAEPHYGAPGGIEHWTTADILRESSNVGTIEIAQRMHNQELADGLHAFGLGSPTAIDWPYQPHGLLLDPAHYYATGKYSTAIGYGVAVTGMQMLDAFTTIANGGVSRPPRLLDATIDANGVRHPAPTAAGARVVSPNTAAEMTHMLEGVVAQGTGACAAIPSYVVAGKTGTAKKALPTGGYTSNATMASFIGFAPADHPRFAAIVVLDENNLSYGGEVAAPVFSEIMQFALQQYGVSPTDLANQQFAAAQATAKKAGNSCTVPHGSALAAAEAGHAAAAASQTSTPSPAPQQIANQAAHSGTGQGNGGTAVTGTTADSLPPDPSAHT
jgi:cell division protein FtsI (penicillin-binding protein 3)